MSIKHQDKIEDIYRFSPAQSGMFFHSMENSTSRAYIIQLMLDLQGQLSVETFESAWLELCNRHQILKTKIGNISNGKPTSIILKDVVPQWIMADYSELDEMAQKERFDGYVIEDREKGISLEQFPLMRFYLVKLNENKYKFLWTYHHIVIDGWSLPVLISELFEIYKGKLSGNPIVLGTPTPYKKYIQWLDSFDSAKAELYWKNLLAGMRESASLPRKSKATVVEYTPPKVIKKFIPADVTSQLTATLRKHGLTLNTLLQAAWVLALGYYKKSNDVIIGNVVSGRSDQLIGSEKIVGMMINTIPNRIVIDKKSKIIHWLTAIQENFIKRGEYENSSLVDIMAWGGGSNRELFDTVFTLENYPIDIAADSFMEKGFFRITDICIEEESSYPLSLLCTAGEQLELKILFDVNAYHPKFIEDLLFVYQYFIEQLLIDPGASIEYVQKAQVAHFLECPLSAIPSFVPPCYDELFHNVVDRWASASSTCVAAEHSNNSITYAELKTQSDNLAAHLIQNGVKCEHKIGICMDRSIEMLICLLGVMKSGAVYVPLEPAIPDERLKYILDDANVELVIYDDLTQNRFSSMNICGFNISEVSHDPHAFLLLESLPEITPDNAAYIIYTSGSTGNPKGVLVTHGGLIQYINWGKAQYKLEGKQCNSIVHTSIGFDATITSMFIPLAIGGCATFVSVGDELEKLTELFENLDKYSLIKITPAHMAALLPRLEVAESVFGMDIIFVIGGESLHGNLVKRWKRFFPNAILINEYGPTETVVGCSFYQVDNQAEYPGNIPIGIATDNSQLYVLDENLNPVPSGVIGELYIAGSSVARGYQGMPAATAAVFLPDPFSGIPNSRMYKSGDMVRSNGDENLEFLGRKDSQIKLRGYRVELEEVEHVLRRANNIDDVVVLVREQNLAAFFTIKGGPRHDQIQIIDSEAGRTIVSCLKQLVEALLPSYMHPTYYIALTEMPMTNNGKYDRSIISKIEIPLVDTSESISSTHEHVALSKAESHLYEIWKSVLKRESFSLDIGFVELGGHSLLATIVISRIKKEMNVKLTIKEFFDANSVRRMAKVIDSKFSHSADLLEKIKGMSEDDVKKLSKELIGQ